MSKTSQSGMISAAPGQARELAIVTVTPCKIGEIDGFNNPHPRCPVVVLVDSSGSMEGAPIAEASKGVSQLYQAIARDDLASLRAEVMALSFGETIDEVVPFGQPVEVSAGMNFDLVANGNTPLGAAVNRAIRSIEARRASYRDKNLSSYSPWVVILSDGAPTDNGWEQAAERLRLRAEEHKWNVLCVAIGGSAHVENLQRFCVLPVQRLDGLKFSEFFRWLSDSLRVVSQSSTSARILNVSPASKWAFNP